MANTVEKIILTYGGVDLDDIIEEMTDKRSRGVKRVMTMNKARLAKGFKRGNIIYDITFKAVQTDNPLAPNWDDLMESGEEFSLKKVPNVGPPVSFYSVTVTDVEESHQDGDSTVSVTAQALKRVRG